MSNNEDVRNVQMKFRVTEKERQFILKKSEVSGCKNASNYLRKMALTGQIIKYDSDSIKDLRKRMINIQSNINQIAVRVNSTGNIYSDDIEEIQEKVGEIWRSLTSIQSALLLT